MGDAVSETAASGRPYHAQDFSSHRPRRRAAIVGLAVVAFLTSAAAIYGWARETTASPHVVTRTVPSKDGTPIAFTRLGTGPALVLIDGGRELALPHEARAGLGHRDAHARRPGADGSTAEEEGRERLDASARSRRVDNQAEGWTHALGAQCRACGRSGD
jgi:hypothetical protein